MKKEKPNVVIMVSTYDEAHQFGEVFDADLERVFHYVAYCQERRDFDWAVNNHFNDDESPTVFTVIIL